MAGVRLIFCFLLCAGSAFAAPKAKPGDFPEATPTAPPSSEPKTLDDFFHPYPEGGQTNLSSPLSQPAMAWDFGIAWTYPDMANGFPGVATSLSTYSGYFAYTRLGIALYGLSNLLIAPGLQYAFFLFDNRLRIQPHFGLAFFISGNTVLHAWAQENTFGLGSGVTIAYSLSSRWSLVLHVDTPIYFTSPLRLRPHILLGGAFHFF